MKGARTRWRGVGRDRALRALKGCGARRTAPEQVGARRRAEVRGPEAPTTPRAPRSTQGRRGRSRPDGPACPRSRPRPAPSNESLRLEGLSACSGPQLHSALQNP
jgi:hypothetical protein